MLQPSQVFKIGEMMVASIDMKIPQWVNWIAQDSNACKRMIGDLVSDTQALRKSRTIIKEKIALAQSDENFHYHKNALKKCFEKLLHDTQKGKGR